MMSRLCRFRPQGRFPGEGRGPVSGLVLARAARRCRDLRYWAPAFAGEVGRGPFTAPLPLRPMRTSFRQWPVHYPIFFALSGSPAWHAHSLAALRNPAYVHGMRRCLWLGIMFAVAACTANPYSSVPDEVLHAKAKKLTLPDRYDLYIEVLHSRTPSRPIIADDVAALGPPAWKYVFGRAVGGGFAEISDALPVLFSFDRRCSPNELKQLRDHVNRVSKADTAKALNSSIDSLCGDGMPAGD